MAAERGRSGKRTPPGSGRRARQGAPRVPGELPSPEDILEFLRTVPGKAGKREIARAFAIKGGDRIALKSLLAEMTAEGLIEGGRKTLKESGALPPVAPLEIVGRDDDGDLIAEPLVWEGDAATRPRLLVLEAARISADGEPPLGVGDRVLARCQRLEEPDVAGFRYEAVPIKRLPRDRRRLVGIFRAAAGARGGGTIEPVDRKALRSWPIAHGDEAGARDGDLVRFDLNRAGRFGLSQARIAEVLGNPDDQRKVSLIAVHAHAIPDEFPASVLGEATRLTPASLAGRLDLRELPLVTIDPSDARDHDDAVHACPDPDPANAGGHIVTVAIADVAHFVASGSRLDREALVRGNSVYFPDRVVPMLPERISNDLCSLKEGEDRACIAVRIVIDAKGGKRRHTFHRALMRSAAKLSYQEAQAAIDGRPSATTGALLEPVLKPLWAAHAALATARDARSPLDLEIAERRIVLGADGRVSAVVTPERLAAHRLIEEMMIQANVAAAETLEAHQMPVVYRVHDQPTKEKLKALRDFLATLDLKLAGAGGATTTAALNGLLARARGLTVPDLVNEVVLRSQAQAEYAPVNIGHFGLNLRRYAHFTSPIRRYADLLVHRALIRALKLGDDGLGVEEARALGETCKRISEAERRAMAAERETVDRLVAAHLADRVGARFEARVAGVTRSGLFVRLKDTGADGFVPASALGSDYFRHHEAAHALIGDRTGESFQLGDDVEVKLVEAIASAGALRFEMLSTGKPQRASLAKGLRGRSRRPGRRR